LGVGQYLKIIGLACTSLKFVQMYLRKELTYPMVKIRLRRTGAKKKPTYRVVITDARAPRDGHFVEIIGYYDPRTEPITFNIEEDRVLYWLSVGAQPTDVVRKLLTKSGTLERFAEAKTAVAA
jgi:small subunit ribosomal protein S16